MSVVGFDIGNVNCFIGVARQGGIEVITNDYSLHATPACVSFNSKNRQMGVSARQQVNSNFKNTIIYFKHLIGRKFSDPIAQKFIPFVPCQVVQLPDDNIGLNVSYQDQQQVFTPEQVLAALLTKLRQTIETQLVDVKKVTDCVMAVPFYFTDVQRRAAHAATQAAGLNALRIVNESTAIALAYGIYKQDLPEESAPSRNVVFLDVGHSQTQASLVAFNKGKLTMLGSTYSTDIGGMWFDALIREKFYQDFLKTYKVDAKKNPRAWLRLLDEVEKVKKQMSANQTPIPINIECFMDDKDVTGKMQRAEFEELAASHWEAIRQLLVDLLANAKKTAADIHEIEIVGGSSRIPMIRKIINDVFGKDAKTTMNQDEAVARGAAMQCAILSPSFRVREFAVKDAHPYSIKLSWQGVQGAEGGESEVFVPGDEFPFSKMLTLYRNENVLLNAVYSGPVPHTTTQIGQWVIDGVKPDGTGEPRKLKVKVRVNPNGLFSVCQATMYETQVVEEKAPEPMEADGAAPADEAAPAPAEGEEGKPKTKTVAIDLKVIETLPFNYPVEHYAKVENQMQAADLKEKLKADAKNSVEEYVYEMRDKLCDSLADFISETDAEAFRANLTATEDWLYDEGEDAEQAVYEARLAELKKCGDPVQERAREFEGRQNAFDQFDQSIMRSRKAYDEYAAGSEKYSHISSDDMTKVISAIEENKKWLDEQRHKSETRAKTDVPAVFVHEIKAKQSVFGNIVLGILNKPKPAAPKEEPPKAEKKEETKQPADMDVD